MVASSRASAKWVVYPSSSLSELHVSIGDMEVSCFCVTCFWIPSFWMFCSQWICWTINGHVISVPWSENGGTSRGDRALLPKPCKSHEASEPLRPYLACCSLLVGCYWRQTCSIFSWCRVPQWAASTWMQTVPIEFNHIQATVWVALDFTSQWVSTCSVCY